MSYNDANNRYSTASGTASSLTAFYDRRAEAESAVDALKAAGITNDAIRLVPGFDADADETINREDRKGFWASLGDLFFPDADRLVYAEGLRRGGYLLSVTVSDAIYEKAHDILDEEGSIDIDERADQWRGEGWDENAAPGSLSSYANRASLGTANEDTFAADTSDNHSSRAVDDNLGVGKRDVTRGGAKVRAYTTETPMSKDTSLHDREVPQERRSIDHAPTDSDAGLQDHSISTDVDDQHMDTQKQDGFSQSQGFKRN